MPVKSKENNPTSSCGLRGTGKGLAPRSFSEVGQFLAELMVAMTVMVIGLLGAFTLLSQSLGLARVIANQYVAANLAAEGIEVVKNIIDTNRINDQPFNANFSSPSFAVALQYNTCVDYRNCRADLSKYNQLLPLSYDSGSGLYSYDSGNETRFKRVINIENLTDEIKVNSVVTWQERGGREFSINLEDHFYNYSFSQP